MLNSRLDKAKSRIKEDIENENEVYKDKRMNIQKNVLHT